MNVINDISAFCLSIFGIGITVFTVIYSFIYNKAEYINEAADSITKGNACPETIAKFKIAGKYIERQKSINRIILLLSISSLVLYVLSQLYLHVFLNLYFGYIIIALTILFLAALVFSLIIFFRSYFRYIR
jgi:hypothetical protein